MPTTTEPSTAQPSTARSTRAQASTRSPLPGYLFTFIVLGMLLSINGPALVWLRERTGVGIGMSGLILAGGSIGYIAGSFFAGKPFDRGAGHRLLIGVGAGAVVIVTLLTWVSSFVGVVVVIALIGAAGGTIDVGGNTLVVWSQPPARIGSTLNALHLCFGIGALATPLLVSRSLAWSGNLNWVAGAIGASIIVVALLLRGVPAPQRRAASEHQSTDPAPSSLPLLLICLFFFLYVGSEVTFIGWASTYAEVISWGGINGPSVLATLFLAGFTVGRVIGIVLAGRLSMVTLFMGSCLLAMFAAAGLVATDGRAIGVGVMTAVLGASVGPQYPTMMAYGDQHLRLTGSATSRIVSSSGLGGLSLPLLTGWLLDRNGATALPWMTLASLTLTTLAAAAVVVVVTRSDRRSGVTGPNRAGDLVSPADADDQLRAGALPER